MPDLIVEAEEYAAVANEILNDGQKIRIRVRGKSMHPFIHSNDVLEVKHMKQHALIRGDVVLCRLGNGRLVVHRIIKVENGALLIQGDGLPYPDGWIPSSNVLGQVINLTRNGKRLCFSNTWNKYLVRIWLLITPLRSLILKIKRRIRLEIFMKTNGNRDD